VTAPGLPRLIFDGDCGFCTASADWIGRGWDGRAEAVSWQSLGAAGLAQVGLTPDETTSAAWWIDPSGRRYRGHRAMGQALRAARGWRRVAGVLILTPPLTWPAAAAYRLVVRYRYRLPGGTAACRTTPSNPTARVDPRG
jgi:predicted DCC family thiol-disulfide oxidoreductase YuxK